MKTALTERKNSKHNWKNTTLEDVENNEIVNSYILKADKLMNAMGYTEHGLRHATLTSKISGNILQRWGSSSKEIQLAKIAGYLHDIGNCIARANHSQIGALFAYNILTQMNANPDDIASIMGSIGNHEETEGGCPVSLISSALILADKTDVHRSRVTNPDKTSFDIHDCVNYSALSSFLRVDKSSKLITLELKIDTNYSSVMDYFEIFLERMLMCKRAANFMGAQFKLKINNVKLL